VRCADRVLDGRALDAGAREHAAVRRDRTARLGDGRRRAEHASARRTPAGSSPVKVLATRRFVGPAWDELRDVEIGSLDEPRDDVEALVVANELVDKAVLDRFPQLRLVANFGVGYDQIDLAACTRRGVTVTNTPGVLTNAT